MSMINGLPPKRARQKKVLPYVAIFSSLGIGLCLFILLFGNVIKGVGNQINQIGRFMSLGMGAFVLALLIGTVQSWIFKEKLNQSKTVLFILCAALGGFVGGIIGGFIDKATNITPPFAEGLFIGLIAGGIAGACSSLGQNMIMSSADERQRWFFYSTLSSMIIWSLGWALSWGSTDMTMAAVTAAFMMISSGIALFFFMPYTHIEFE